MLSILAVLAYVVMVGVVVDAEDCPITAEPGGFGLKDCTGRQRIFHGVNIVYKGAPWHPITEYFDPRWSASAYDGAFLASLGLNTVRLGVMWPGVCPNPSGVDEKYLKVMRGIVEMFGENNVTSLIDCHQDLLAAQFCGEGAPTWATPLPSNPDEAFPWPIRPPYNVSKDGIPTPEECALESWPSYQPTKANGAAYQALYQNLPTPSTGEGMRDAFGRFWTAVAEEFSTTPDILGYEILNEPWAGDIFEDPLLLIPGVADRENLQPFVDAIAPLIRKADSNRTIYWESVTYDDFIPVGFNTTPASLPNTALSFHFYNPPQLFPADVQIASRLKDAERLHTGAMLTEFDLCDSGGNGASGFEETVDFADAQALSWIGWEYKSFVRITGWCGVGLFNETDNSPNLPFQKVVARTYPHAIAGTASNFSFNSSTAHFHMTYSPTTTVPRNLPTEIYVNLDFYYPKGVQVHLQPSTASWNLRTIKPAFHNLTSYGFVDITAPHNASTVTVDIMPL